MTKQYSESSIKVLKGLEPVKERPGMYTRTDSPTHICQEAIDNAADEALGGFASHINVEIHEDGSLSVSDNGRGIPVGLHPEENVPVVELVFTRLHAGGKFNKTSGDGAYAFSGGLHGVGVSVTNALSRRLEVAVRREGREYRIAFVLSVRMLDPQFQGQTKDKLTNRDALKLVAALAGDPIELWLNQNLEAGKKIAELAIKQAQERMRSVKKIEKRKGSGISVLPGKLTDCESEDIRENELFLVEGDSAGGSAKLARDRNTQAILPLRGKVLNSFEVHRDQLFANTEIHDISVAIGVDPHGEGDSPDLSGLRYGKIAILSDADVDGSHIQVLLLTLFYRHFPELIRRGHIYVAQPPLFRVDVAAQGRKKTARKFYALDQAELEGILEKLRKEGLRENQYSISRFKGLGEMNPDQLKDTTMHPDTRRLLRVHIPEHSSEPTHNVFVKLMGKGESAQRRSWMEAEGDKAELDI